MIKQLRKRHLQTWTLLTLLLPIGILSAWLAIPKYQTNDLLQPVSTNALTVILGSVNKENYSARLRTNNERSAKQLEWVNKSSLTAPSALIYRLNNPPYKNISENDLIGRIDVKGTYHFALKNDSPGKSQFVLYDIIHHHVIDTLNF